MDCSYLASALLTGSSIGIGAAIACSQGRAAEPPGAGKWTWTPAELGDQRYDKTTGK